jgi:hypothetical protein
MEQHWMDPCNQLHAPATLPTPFESDTAHGVGGWVGHRAGLKAVKHLFPWESKPDLPFRLPSLRPEFMGGKLLYTAVKKRHSVGDRL